MELSMKDVAGIPLTPWFPSSIKPARAGVYERKTPFGVTFYSLWNGHHWCLGGVTPTRAAGYRCKSNDQHRPWRGLARDPMLEGSHRADKGRARALEHAGDDWKHAALAKLREFVAQRHGNLFAFETARNWCLTNGLAAPPHPNAWGAIAKSAMAAGIFHPTGEFRPAISPRTHGHPVRLLTKGAA